MIYIKFNSPNNDKEESSTNKVKEFLLNSAIGILKKIIPGANPDYEIHIDKVKTWLVEFDDKSNLPNREMGIDQEGMVIMIMPDDRNCGYWTDNNLSLKDFDEHFDIEDIDEESFNKLWIEFEKKN